MKIRIAVAVVAVSANLIVVGAPKAYSAEDHEHEAKASDTVTVTGEVLDMACYLDHGATGAQHADCAKTCIESGLPVGLKGQDGKTYLLIGEHKPMNKELAALAAKTVTVKGKLVSRDGINMIANAELVKSEAATSYTCPMHPEVITDKPGKCPKCGMNLVKK